jgi:hypothetical protein
MGRITKVLRTWTKEGGEVESDIAIRVLVATSKYATFYTDKGEVIPCVWVDGKKAVNLNVYTGIIHFEDSVMVDKKWNKAWFTLDGELKESTKPSFLEKPKVSTARVERIVSLPSVDEVKAMGLDDRISLLNNLLSLMTAAGVELEFEEGWESSIK